MRYHHTLRLFNGDNIIVACLYIDKEGNLHDDSWIRTKTLS